MLDIIISVAVGSASVRPEAQISASWIATRVPDGLRWACANHRGP